MSFEELLFNRIGDIMSPEVLKAKGDETLRKAAQKMREKGVGAIIIVDDNDKITGIYSERDLIREVASEKFDPDGTSLADVMTKDPIVADVNTSISEVFNIFQIEPFRHLPIVENDKLCGIVSIRDINKVIYKLVAQSLSEKYKS